MLPVKHEINLYLPRFRPPTLSCEVLLLIKAAVLTVAALLLVSLGLWAMNSYTTAKIESLQAQQSEASDQLAALVAQQPNINLDANLKESIKKEEAQLDQQKKVISFLRQDLINERSSFTSLFEQLSQQKVSGIWLSKIEFLNNGKNIQLYGYAQSPEKVSRYISQLGKQDSYIGRTFKQINVRQGEHDWNEFFLSTKKQESETEQSSTITNRAIGGFGL